MAFSQPIRRNESFILKSNKATKADTEFYDISEGTGTLKKQLKYPTLPQLFETTPSKIFSLQPLPIKKSFGFSGKGGSPLDPILHDFKKGTIIFYGHAGSGKTTILKHIAQTVLEDELLSVNGAELVSYIKCQDISPNTPITDEDFLTCGKGLCGRDVDDTVEFMKNDQKKCLFLIDSIELHLNNEEVQDGTKKAEEGKRKPGLILRDLLSGRLFPDARVIATSRDPLLSFLQFPEARLVALIGLSPESMQKIMTDYLGTRQANEEWENLIVKSPYLASLCKTPVFLVYVLMAQTSDKKSSTITTISEVMMRLLECFLRSEQMRQRNVEPVLGGLKSISHEGVERGQYFFSASDFQRHNLSQEGAGDFTSQLLKKFLRGNKLVHFNHVSLQEAFAALYVAEMADNEFKKYAKLRLFPVNPVFHCSVVRIIVFGILLNPAIDKEYSSLLTESHNLKRNKKTLLKKLRKVLKERPHLDDIDMISALHEAQKGVAHILRKNVTSIKVDGIPLLPNDLHVIGSVARRCEHLEELSITQSNLAAYVFEKLYSAMKDSSVTVSQVSISKNPNLGPEGLEHTGKLASECKANSVKMDGCILHHDDVLSFQKAIGKHQLKMVDLSFNSEIQTADEMTPETEACTGVFTYKASIDSVRSPSLPNITMKIIKEQLRQEEFEELVDVTGRWKTGTKELAAAVTTLLPCVSEEIKLYGWRFCEQDIEVMKRQLIKINRKGLRISLTRDTFISRNKNEGKVTKTRNEVRCENQGESILVSWDEKKGSKRYDLEILRDGIKFSEHQVATTSFVAESVEPSKKYEFHVSALYPGGKRSPRFLSNPVMTDPKQPIDVEARETEKGILVSWKPAKGDTVESYSVKILCENQKKSTRAVFDGTSYVFPDPTAGRNYQFGVRAYNHFGRRGEMTLSNTIKVLETRETPSPSSERQTTDPTPSVPDSTPQISVPIPVNTAQAKESDKRNETYVSNKKGLADVQTADELRQWCAQRHESDVKVHLQAIQIAHRPFDATKAQFLGSMLKLSSTVGELELRDCALTGELLDCLRNTLHDLDCQVEELVVSAQQNMEGIIRPLCAIINVLSTEVLNLAENNLQYGNVATFSDSLSKYQVKCLKGLDISFNRNIENWEDVGQILKQHSMTIFKAMNCDLTVHDIQKLKQGYPEGKIRQLDLSYNCELTVECFEMIPRLMSLNAKSIALSECGLTQCEIAAFDSSCPMEMTVETIDVSYNEDLETGGMAVLGDLLVNRGTTNLSLAGCNLDGKLMETLSSTLGDHKLTKVDMSDNCSIGDDIEEVAGFISKQQVENLDISDCGLSSGQITSFQSGLGNTQIAVLNLSDSSREADTVYIQSVCQLIPSVTEELTIIYPHMEHGCLKIIQKTLDKLDGNGPKVTYGMMTESTSLVNDIKFTARTEKKFLEKNFNDTHDEIGC